MYDDYPEHIPDFVEQGEAKIEDFICDYVCGDLMRCLHCEQWLPIKGEWVSVSPDPYANPICGECAYETMPDYRKFCNGEI